MSEALHNPKNELERSKIPGHTHNKLSAFCLYPEGVSFDSLGEKEEIIALLRQHIVVNVKWILIAGLMLLAPSIVMPLGIFKTLPIGLSLVISLSWYLITMAYALENFLSWYFNVYIITNHRVVDVDFSNMVYKQVSDAYLDKVQDVTYNMGGVVRTLFNYGNVFVQTAGEVTEFDFLAVPSPDKVAKIIQDLSKKH